MFPSCEQSIVHLGALKFKSPTSQQIDVRLRVQLTDLLCVKTRVSNCVISINTSLGTDGIEKVVDEDENQPRFSDRTRINAK